MKINKVLAQVNWSEEMCEKLKQLFSPAEIEFVSSVDDPSLDKLIHESDMAIIAGEIDRRYLSSSSIKWIHCDRSGIDRFASQELADSEILVTTSSGRSAPVLAEHALFFMLCLCYNAQKYYKAQSLKAWGIPNQRNLRGLNRKKICIVGYGATAKCLINLCNTLDMEIRVFRRRSEQLTDPHVRFYSLDAGHNVSEAMNNCDVVALCASLNDSSYQMIDEQALNKLNKGAILINVARHQLVDEAALIRTLKSGQLSGAGLDVTDPQEPLPPWNKLWFAPNVLITPHITPQMQNRTGRTLELLQNNLERYQRQETLHQLFTSRDVFTTRNQKQFGFLALFVTKAWNKIIRSII